MKMRKLTVLAAGALFGALAVPGIAAAGPPPPPKSPCFAIQLQDPKNPDKVSLCHFTGGTTIVTNEVSASAWQSHLSHHGDCYKFFGQDQVCIF